MAADCFGFNANLPQLLKGCGLQWFMTQKLSWNESNLFPTISLGGKGLTAPNPGPPASTNDYNFSNNPSSFLQSEARYAQGELCDSFLNLYGIGDGGGGPTREHIEYGLRQRDLEGVPRFRFAKGQDFFDHLQSLDKSLLPSCSASSIWSFTAAPIPPRP
jgi:alpha-mannosidase